MVAVGFVLVWLVVPTVGKRVFLRVVSAIHTVMHGMTPSVATVKKAALGRSKSPPLAVKKTAAYWTPLSGSPLGTSVSLCSCASAGVDIVVGRCRCRCRPTGIALGHHSASHLLDYGHDPCHAVLGDYVMRSGCCCEFIDCHHDPCHHHCWLVSFDTWARAYCHVSSCLMIRVLVSNDTRWRCGLGRARA